jgi:O-acetyl-ADP-ribose deacetylase (regulator of RNase III)
MIELKQGDILRANAEALVNTVNCVGVMGRGLALQFKKVFPDNFKCYKTVCDRKELQPGKMLIYDLNRLHKPRYVVNFPTKRHWKGKSRMEDIEAGLQTLVSEVQKRDILSIAIPPLGCGLGGLCWSDVRAKIEEAFQGLTDVQVLLYEPKDAKFAEEKNCPSLNSDYPQADLPCKTSL